MPARMGSKERFLLTFLITAECRVTRCPSWRTLINIVLTRLRGKKGPWLGLVHSRVASVLVSLRRKDVAWSSVSLLLLGMCLSTVSPGLFSFPGSLWPHRALTLAQQCLLQSFLNVKLQLLPATGRGFPLCCISTKDNILDLNYLGAFLSGLGWIQSRREVSLWRHLGDISQSLQSPVPANPKTLFLCLGHRVYSSIYDSFLKPYVTRADAWVLGHRWAAHQRGV